MGLYATQIFPRLMDWSLRGDMLAAERQDALASAEGQVLEIGFGTGLNLAFYPPAVTHVTAVDPARLLPRRVAARIAAARMPVELHLLSAERLPFAGRRFDCVVSTWTLCSIPNLPAALHEIRRVLKPTGQFLFLEHGRSDDAGTAWWQDLWNPVQRRLAGGCNVNRRLDRSILEAGFGLLRLDRDRLPAVPRVLGELYRGAATPTPQG